MPNVIDAVPGFLFGADPELFLSDQYGKFISAEGLIPGTKEEPFKVPGGAIQVDGMAAEFNIDPSASFQEFDGNIKKVVRSLRNMLPDGVDLNFIPSVTFTQDVWDASPEKAKELGCSPDFNAWTGQVNPPPQCEAAPTLRTASGHLHIGWTEDAPMSDNEHIANCRDLVKQLDWYLGGWSLKVDPDPTRRNLYGKAGACRFKSYGVEYRVLSNFWLTSMDRRAAVWNRMQTAILDMRSNFIPDHAAGYNEILIESINTSKRNKDLETAFKFPIYSASTN